eukprot:gene4931-8528_t
MSATLNLAIALAVVFLYVGIGTLFFHLAESVSFVDSLFWASILNSQTQALTQVYTDSSFEPTKDISKMFTIFYILAGFFIVGFTFAEIVEVIFEKEDEFFRARMEKRTFTKKKLTLYKLLVIFIIYVVCFFLGVATYFLGEEWSLVDSMYYTIVTSTDLGETELHPTKGWTKLMATFLVLSTASLFSFTIGTIAEFIAEKFKQDIADKFFSQKVSKATLADMDANEDGKVSRIEFLEYMLTNCEMVDEDDIKRIHERFEFLDADQSGYLNLDDAQINN